MNFYDKVKKLQSLKQNKGVIVLVRCGVFFTGIGKDGVILSEKYGYVPVCSKEKVCKCGMPVRVINRLVKKMVQDNREFVIYDYDKNNIEKYTKLLRLEGKHTYEDRNCIGCEECWYKHNRITLKIEYVLKDINKPIGISEYELIKSIPEDLKSDLPTVEEIENEIEEKLK